MKRRLVWIVMVLLFSFGVTFAAETDINQDTFFKLFTCEKSEIANLFDSKFLAQIPAAKVYEIVTTYKTDLGNLIEVNGQDGVYTLLFEKGTAPAKINLTANQKIIGLWFGAAILNTDNPDKIITEMKAIPGKVSVCIIKNNRDLVFSYHEDLPMAVGSTFKLYVLKAIYDTVGEQKKTWEKILYIDNKNKSIPSGILQDWPEGSPITLKTLTNLMISISDNTATDHLIDFIGRKKIEKYLPERDKPLLKTGEWTKLKFCSDSGLQQKYIKGSQDVKGKILADIATQDFSKLKIGAAPVLIEDLEWFFSTKELCKIIYDLKDAGEIRINPGLADKKEWYLVGYKGGSEPGVLQYTHLLQKTKDGDLYSIAVTVNNKDGNVNESQIGQWTNRFITMIKEGKF